MIKFTIREILGSVISATIFGAGFSFLIFLFYLSLEIIKGTAGVLLLTAKNIFYDVLGRNITKNIKGGRYFRWIRGMLREAAVFSKIVLFSLGFIMLSYYALDGEIRLYMLVVSSAVALFFGKLFTVLKDRVNRALNYITSIISKCFCFLLKILFLPIKKVLFWLKKMSKLSSRNKAGLLDK